MTMVRLCCLVMLLIAITTQAQQQQGEEEEVEASTEEGAPTLAIFLPFHSYKERTWKSEARRAAHVMLRQGVQMELVFEFMRIGEPYNITERALQLIEAGADAMLFHYDYPVQEVHADLALLLDISNEYEIPLMIYNSEGYTPNQGRGDDGDELVLSLMPTYKQQVAAVSTLMQHKGWPRLILVTEDPQSAAYLTQDLDIDYEVCELRLDDVAGSVNRLATMLNQAEAANTPVFVIGSSEASLQFNLHLKESELLNSSAIFLFSVGSVDMDDLRTTFPVGSYVLEYGQDADSYIGLGVMAFGEGLASADLVGMDVPHTSGASLYLAMQVGDTERGGEVGFDDDGQSISASFFYHYINSEDYLYKIGRWQADGTHDILNC